MKSLAMQNLAKLVEPYSCVEVGKVASLEEAAVKQIEESSTKLREVEDAVRASSLDELNAASHRHERLLKQSVAKLQQESEAAQAFRSEARAALEGLRNAVGALKVEQKFASQRADSAIAELRGEKAVVQGSSPHLRSPTKLAFRIRVL